MGSGSLDHGREQHGGGSLRAWFIGLMAAVLIGFAGPYWGLYKMSSRMFADYHGAGAVFGLVVCILFFNVLLGRVSRRFALHGSELRFITAMMLVSSIVVSTGLVAYMVPSIARPHYMANASNMFETRALPHVPKVMFPLDPDGGRHAVTQFWSGIPDTEPIPWSAWRGPLVRWGIFVGALFAAMMAFMALLRKQWQDYEHLSYPIAQVPTEICRAVEDPRAADGILHNRAFWVGVGFAALVSFSAAMGNYFGGWPNLRIRHDVTGLGPIALRMNFDLVIIGLVFLIPNRVSFSIWALSLTSWVARSFIRTYDLGLDTYMAYGVVGHPELQHMAMGCMLVFTFGSLYLGRRHLARTVQCALGRDPGYDAGEPCSYRSAYATLALGLAVFVGGLMWAGMKPMWACLLLLMAMVVWHALTRVAAQCGIPSFGSPAHAETWMVNTLGSQNLGPQQTSLLGMHLSWHVDIRGSAMSSSGHGMYLNRAGAGGLFWAMLAALAVSYAVASSFAVYLGYRHGAGTMNQWFAVNSSTVSWSWTNAQAVADQSANFGGMIWALAGAAAMAALMVAQRSFFWWPIHPVGFLASGSFIITAFWFSIFLSWLIKTFIVKFGGHRTYRTARMFFVGMVVGQFVAAGLFAVLDTFIGVSYNEVFAI